MTQSLIDELFAGTLPVLFVQEAKDGFGRLCLACETRNRCKRGQSNAARTDGECAYCNQPNISEEKK